MASHLRSKAEVVDVGDALKPSVDIAVMTLKACH